MGGADALRRDGVRHRGNDSLHERESAGDVRQIRRPHRPEPHELPQRAVAAEDTRDACHRRHKRVHDRQERGEEDDLPDGLDEGRQGRRTR